MARTMDIHEIERLLDQQSLLPAAAVDAVIANLEAAALQLRDEPGSREAMRVQLRLLAEYRALRAFALRHGWHDPSASWPLRPDAQSEPAVLPPAARVAPDGPPEVAVTIVIHPA